VVSEAATDPARPAPGTLDDLISDAAAVGLPFNERLARDWHSRGLLGSPSRQPLGRGRGSDPAIYTLEQRALFQAIARNRAAGITLRTLATLPVWAWINYDDVVDLEQLRRALESAIGDPRQSYRRAAQTAKDLLRIVDAGYDRRGGRGRLHNELIEQLRRGRIDKTRLLPLVKAVFEPAGITVVRGPIGASVSADTLTRQLHLAFHAATRLKVITDEQLLAARAIHQQSYSDYDRQRPMLAATAGGLAWLFEEQTFDQQVRQSVSQLLLLLGLQLDAARTARQGQR
jgi:hypothetical protein